MPINFRMSGDFDGFGRLVRSLERNLVRTAAGQALKQTIRAVERREREALPTVLDRPTPFTVEGIASRMMPGDRPRASLFFAAPQAGWLGPLEMGGTRRPAGRAIVVPVNAPRDAHGNLPRGIVKQLAADKRRYFTGKMRGKAGLWQRTGAGRLTLLASFKPSASYRPILGTRDRLAGSWRSELPRALGAAVAEAFAKARR